MADSNRMRTTLGILALLLLARSGYAEERILADDGREVLLKDDGSWEYVSDDRFGTTGSGERVRLGADGRWEIEIDARPVAPAGGVVLADTGPARWALGDVTIETARSQRGGSKKGVSKKTATVFTLEVRREGGSGAAQQWLLQAGDFSVVDSAGREYPVLDIAPSRLALGAGELQRVVVRADGSPHWFTTKFYELRIAAGAVGNRDEIRLRRALANVRQRDIE